MSRPFEIEGKKMEYRISYRNGCNDTPGVMCVALENDQAAMDMVTRHVGDGFRNEASASVELSDGTYFVAWNQHGKVLARIDDPETGKADQV
jgi:hypothetical protein